MTLKFTDPFISLGEFGFNAATLNETFLVGANINFCRPLSLDDYESVGLDYIFAKEDEGEASLNKYSENTGTPVEELATVSFIIATGTVESFFEKDNKLFVLFDKPISTPLGTSMNTWELPCSTVLLFPL